MKKHNPPFTRRIRIDLDPANLNALDGFSFDFTSGGIVGVNNGQMAPITGDTLINFERDRLRKVPKLLQQVAGAGGSHYWQPDAQLLSFKQIVAIDTNTRIICGSKVSVTAAIHLVNFHMGSGKYHCLVSNLATFEFWNAEEKQENIGWCHILNLLSHQQVLFHSPVALLVDSDLGNHAKFNARSLPLFEDYVLPDQYTICYASDEANTLGGQLIRHCHKLAGVVLKRTDLATFTGNLYGYIDAPYSHARSWDVEHESFPRFKGF